MEIFSALLAICAGNSPVPGEFPAQRPVTRSFDAFCDLRPNKRLSKQWQGWWFETPSSPLWRHYEGVKCKVGYYFETTKTLKTITRTKNKQRQLQQQYGKWSWQREIFQLLLENATAPHHVNALCNMRTCSIHNTNLTKLQIQQFVGKHLICWSQFILLSLTISNDFAWSISPDSKVHGANMGPTWVLSAPDGPHVGPMNLAIRVLSIGSIQLNGAIIFYVPTGMGLNIIWFV